MRSYFQRAQQIDTSIARDDLQGSDPPMEVEQKVIDFENLRFLRTATKLGNGIYHSRSYMDDATANYFLLQLNHETFPWNEDPLLDDGRPHAQQAYFLYERWKFDVLDQQDGPSNNDEAFKHDQMKRISSRKSRFPLLGRLRNRRKRRLQTLPSRLSTLETICRQIETDWGVLVRDVYCNKIENGDQFIDWHHDDPYKLDTLIVTLGAPRKVDFRPRTAGVHKNSRSFEEPAFETVSTTFIPRSGDAYFVPLSVHRATEHRVRPVAGMASRDLESDTNDTHIRISLVFFVEMR